MKYELMQQLAKIKAMRGQCLETRKKINSAKEDMHDDVQNNVEIYSAMARKEKPGSDVAYANFLKNRGMLNC